MDTISVFEFTASKTSLVSITPLLSQGTKFTLYPRDSTHSAEARTASCSISEVTNSALLFLLLMNGILIIQLSASVPPLVNVISFGAAPKWPAILSRESSRIFLAFLESACPPDEFAKASASVFLYASNATSLIGVLAAWSK